MQCGLCTVVAGLFRRAMCITSSRRGSGESCYQELATDMQERRHSQMEDAEIELIKASEIVKRVKNVHTEEVRLNTSRFLNNRLALYWNRWKTYRKYLIHESGSLKFIQFPWKFVSESFSTPSWTIHSQTSKIQNDAFNMTTVLNAQLIIIFINHMVQT